MSERQQSAASHAQMAPRTAAELAGAASEDLPYVLDRCYPPVKSSIGPRIPPPQEKLFAEDSGRCPGPPRPRFDVLVGCCSYVRLRKIVPHGRLCGCPVCRMAGRSAG